MLGLLSFLFIITHCACQAVHPDLPAPNLILGGVGSTSVELEWKSKAENISVEWRLLPEDLWFPAVVKVLSSVGDGLKYQGYRRVRVSHLSPYTTYLFRLEAGGVYSPPSRGTETKAEGRPGSGPRLLSIHQLPQQQASIEFLPPTLPNSEITSYPLFFSAMSGQFKDKEMGKDILPNPEAEKQSYIIGPLECNTTYRIKLQAKSVFGVSDPVLTQFNCTCPHRKDNFVVPWVLFIMDDSLFKKDLRLNNLLFEATLLSKVEENIKSMDLHFEYRYVYMITTSGSLLRETLLGNLNGTEKRIVLSKGENIEHVTVAWLYDKIYLLKAEKEQRYEKESWFVDICDLEGKYCKKMQHVFSNKPQYLQVDPYHGYLYWVERGSDSMDSLLRVNLTMDECITFPQRMLKSAKLGQFVVSFENSSLFIPVMDRNRTFKVSLHPPFEVTILYETLWGEQKFDDVEALVYYNDRFYWTSPIGFNVEYVEKMQYSYSTMDTEVFSKVMKLLYPSNQPFPVPLNSVEDLQVIFDSTKAMIKWSDPVTGLEEGCASYRAWKYRIQINDNLGNIIAHYDNITDMNVSQDGNLSSNRLYSVRVQPFSKGGTGPWSKPFSGKTLNTEKTPSIFWADHEKIHMVDLFGYKGKSFSHNSSAINSILWLENSSTLLWSSSDLIFTNPDHKIPEQLRNEESVVESMVYECLGQRIYYSIPGIQEIRRINMEGDVEVKFHLTSAAKNLMVDSSIAQLCWISFLNGLECSLLNGANQTVLFDISIWNDKKILSAAIDPQNHDVYFILYNPLRFPMYEYHKKNLITKEHEKLGSLTFQHIESSLYYTSGKLLFLEGQNSIVTFDMEGKSISRLLLSSKTLSFTLSFDLNSLVPSDFGDLQNHTVLPNSVKSDSVKILELNEGYLLTWEAVNNTNYGEVNYEVSFQSYVANVQSANLSISEMTKLRPYQLLNISLTAYTTWARSPTTNCSVNTPESVPSQPRNLRVFWTGLTQEINEYTLRWDEPEYVNGKLLYHIIQCIELETQQDICPNLRVPHSNTQTTIQLKKSNIRFTITSATASGQGVNSSPFVSYANQTNPIPQVVLGYEKPPRLVLTDVDSGIFHLFTVPIKPYHIIYDGVTDSVYFSNTEGELYQLNLKTEKVSFCRRLGSVDIVQFDWIGRYLYIVSGKEIKRIGLENHESNMQDIFDATENIQTLDIDSFGTFYFTDIKNNMFTFKLSNLGHITDIVEFKRTISADKACNCNFIDKIDKFAVFSHSQQIRLAARDKSNGKISVSDSSFCLCNKIANTITDDRISIQVDLTNIYILSTLNNYIISINLDSGKETIINPLPQNDVLTVEPVCSQCQIMELKDCVTIGSTPDKIEFEAIRETYAFIRLPFPKVDQNCSQNIQLPSTNYTVFYKPKENVPRNLTWHDFDSAVYYSTGNFGKKKIKIEKLKPSTNYTICMIMTNIYSKTTQNVPNEKICGEFITDEGQSGPPQNIKATVLSPFQVLLTWDEPSLLNSNKLAYEIHWKSTDFINGAYVSGEIVVNQKKSNTKIISNLPANETFQIWMNSVSSSAKRSLNSEIEQIKTFSTPQLIKINYKKPRVINFRWTSSEQSVETHQFLFYSKTANSSRKLVPEKPMLSEYVKTYNLSLENLIPSHCYVIKVLVTYKTNKNNPTEWPESDDVCFMTEKDKPLVPGVPTLSLKESQFLAVLWKENEEGVLQYELQKKEIFPNSEWETIYNDTINEYVASGLAYGNYSFRVRAFNNNGYSDFSPSSPIFDMENFRMNVLNMRTSSSTGQVTIGVICASVIGFVLIIFIIYILLSKSKFAKKKTLFFLSYKQPPDLELANLRELPIRGRFINANTVYNQMDEATDEDLAMIPKIKRSQITLTKFLGSGAFGEVFEGLIKELDLAEGMEKKIAVKTLRKGATDTEKLEFLKEAKLMWNFKHEHILNLNAICLDNDPNFLILELMEAGDLLSYLRAHRSKGKHHGITLLDLVEMCLDVAKGCEYLEQMHFVHRDLAARNCLVSSAQPSKRRVKIGDFGLARDIYKNDYYRKEGEGLLPVRWMAPESLMDGIFTCQSDVWSFGVLLWEILTMGGMPYPTMNNREVMLYVRSGRRLEQPPGSPKRLHELMTSCWSFLPTERPSFKMCVQEIGCLLDVDTSLGSLSASYLTYIQDNRLESQCSRDFHSATTLPASQVSHGCLDPTVPNYLQLLHQEYETPSNHSEYCSCDIRQQRRSEQDRQEAFHMPYCNITTNTGVNISNPGYQSYLSAEVFPDDFVKSQINVTTNLEDEIVYSRMDVNSKGTNDKTSCEDPSTENQLRKNDSLDSIEYNLRKEKVPEITESNENFQFFEEILEPDLEDFESKRMN